MSPNATAVAPARSDPQARSVEQTQYLTFTLGKETYAIGILNIKEILEYGQPTSVPMMPEFVRGIINLRGAAVPVVDLLVRFGAGPARVTKRTCIVIVEVDAASGGQDFGVVVDAVSEVLEIANADIEPRPGLGTRISAEFIQGMGKVDGEFVIILDVNRLLSAEELAAVGQTAEAVPAQ